MLVIKTLPVFAALSCFGSVSGAIEKVGSNVILNVTDYYTVVAANGSDALDLFTSVNLINWTFQNAIFDPNSVPLWADPSTLQDPDITVIGTNGVRIYFAAVDKTSHRFAVSVAFSDVIESDRYYSTVNRPLVQDARKDYLSPSFVIQSLTKTPYLIYVSPNENRVFSALLSADGLAVEGPTNLIIEPSLEWENGDITHAWVVEENDMFYVFYTSSSESVIGVAKGVHPLGPFVKREKPVAYVASSDLESFKMRQTMLDREGWLLFADL